MTEAMPFLQKTILLSYAPRPFGQDFFFYFRLKRAVFPYFFPYQLLIYKNSRF